jgi:hypothetical protein
VRRLNFRGYQCMNEQKGPLTPTLSPAEGERESGAVDPREHRPSPGSFHLRCASTRQALSTGWRDKSARQAKHQRNPKFQAPTTTGTNTNGHFPFAGLVGMAG